MCRNKIRSKERANRKRERRVRRAFLIVSLFSLAMSIVSILAVPMHAVSSGTGFLFAVLFVSLSAFSGACVKAVEL